MEKNSLLCISIKYADLLAGRMKLSKKWAISQPALFQREIIISLSNGESSRVKVKRDSSGQVVLYGDLLEHFIVCYRLHHDYSVDFQNDGGNQFLVRIRDTQGVEIEYEMNMIDNSRLFKSKNKGTPASLCKVFGEQEATDGYLVMGDSSRWAIETRPFNDGTIRMYGAEFRKLVIQYGITYGYRAIFYYGEESAFYLSIFDMEGVEIGYEVVDKMNRIKDVSTSAAPLDTTTDDEFFIIDGSDSESDSDSFDVPEDGHIDLVLDEAYWNAQNTLIDIHYYNGLLIGGTFGEDGKPGFMKKMSAAICIRMQPIYIPRSFVRKHLLPNGKPTVALMCFGLDKKVECTIRWGGASNSEDVYIAGGVPLLMDLLKSDVGQTVLFHLVDLEEVESLATFMVLKLD
ncbi:hypothetical protein ACFE04_003035 [Oxalis oulophora]